MNAKLPLLVCAGIASASLAACGNDHQNVANPQPVPVTQTLDTAQVLALAESTTETGAPFQIDYGLIVLGDTSETNLPLAVNGN